LNQDFNNQQMNDSKISVRYAKALYSLSGDKNISENVYQDMNFILHLYSETEEFRLMLDNPVIKSSKKIALFKTLFQTSTHEITYSFLNLLLKNNRENFIDAIARNLRMNEILKQLY